MPQRSMFGAVERPDRWENIRRLFSEVSERNLRNQLAEIEILGQQQEQERRTAMLERWRAGLQGIESPDDVRGMIPMLSEFDDVDTRRQAQRELEMVQEQVIPEEDRIPPPGVESELVRRMEDPALADYMRSTYGIRVDPDQLRAQRDEVPRDVSRMTPYQMLVTGNISEQEFDRMMSASRAASREPEQKYTVVDGELRWNLDAESAIEESINVENQLVRMRDNIEQRIRRREGNRNFERMSPEKLEQAVREEIETNFAGLYDNLVVKAMALDDFIREAIPPPNRPQMEILGQVEDNRSTVDKIMGWLLGGQTRTQRLRDRDGDEGETQELQFPEGGF